jgi:hypothetical protein
VTFNREDPARLTVVGATDLERRLLDAASREHPSPELTQRMRAALGLSIAGAAATTAAAASVPAAPSAPAAAPVAAKAFAAKTAAAWIAAGVLTAGALGGVVGVWLTSRTPGAAPIPALPAPRSEPEPTLAEPAASGVVPGKRLSHAPTAPAGARHHAATAPDLRGEIALIDAARSAVRTGAPDEALSLLRRYRAAYPTGTFRPEAAALEIEALAANGQPEKAAMLARQFLAANPDSPLAPRVARFAPDARR